MFGNRLKKLREEKNITQEKLGQLIGVSARVVGYYESNDRFPKDQQTIINISNYFNVSIDYLLGITNIPLKNKTLNNKNLITLLELLEHATDQNILNIKEYAEFIIAKNKKD